MSVLLKTRNASAIVPVLTLGVVAGFAVGGIAVELGWGPTIRGKVIPLGELIAIASGLVAVGAGVSRLVPFEQRSGKNIARLAAASSCLPVVGAVCIASVSATRMPDGSAWQTMIVNAVIVTAAASGAAVHIGYTRSAIATIALYATAVVAQDLWWSVGRWLPIASITGPGPWLSWPHVLVAAAAFVWCIGASYRFRGMSTFARRTLMTDEREK